MSKRYALFVGDCYYPRGGWSDFVGFFDNAADAVFAVAEPEEDCVSGWWFNVADLETGMIVASAWGIESRWNTAARESGPVEGALTGEEESLFVAHDAAGAPVRVSLKGKGI